MTACMRVHFLCLFRYFSVSVFCSIGLPGFVASLAIAVVNIIFIALSLFVIDKVSLLSHHS